MNKVSGTNFKKTRLIHSGETVDVYEGLHSEFGRQVLIKELSGAASDIVRKDFFREAGIWAQTEHSRFGRIEEINQDRGWVVTEYIPDALKDRVHNSCDLSEVKNATMQILDGLSHLHSKGFLHCNLTSENIRCSTEGIKIFDGRGVSLNNLNLLPRPRGSS